MNVAITGSSGLIGTALVDHLLADGHEVVRIVRGATTDDRPGVRLARWDPTGEAIDDDALEGVDAVVHLAGVGIGDRRWTTEQKDRIRRSRTEGTELIASAVAHRDPMPALLSGSAIGYYGDTGDTPTDEEGAPGDDFPASVVHDWEAAAAPAVAAGARVCFLRTGVVLSPEGGALARMLPYFKAGLGGRSGSGRQWFSWISLPDEVRAIDFLLRSDLRGPVNLVAPEPITNAGWAKALGAALHRPTTVIPMVGPRLLYGRELADSLLLTSQRIDGRRLRDAGFTFRHPTVDEALADLLA